MERDSARLLRPTGDDESVAEESTTSMTEIVSTLLSGLCGCCGALGYQKAEAEEKGMDLVPVERRTSGAKAVRAVLEAEDAAEAEARMADGGSQGCCRRGGCGRGALCHRTHT